MVRRLSLLLSGFAIGVLGCSDPATLPPKGAMAVEVGPAPAGAMGNCTTTGTFSVPSDPGDYANILTEGSDEVRVTDGKKGADVACTIAEEGGAFNVFGNIQRTGMTFSVSGTATSTDGMVTIVESHPDSIRGTGACTLTIDSIHSGAIWAHFSCPTFDEDIARCSANGAFIFENCKQ